MFVAADISKRPMLAIADNALTVMLDMTTTPTAVEESMLAVGRGATDTGDEQSYGATRP